MLSLTLIFHVASAVAFLFCLVWIVRLHKEKRFWRLLWEASRAHSQKKWVLDWPHSFLRNFCHTTGGEASGLGKNDRPCRILLQPWIDLDQMAHFLGVTQQNDRQLTIAVGRELAQEQCHTLISQLEESLEQQFVIKIHVQTQQVARGA
ncbi:MAG: hypothetical protein ACOH5I_11805 [Oligoflexus sp.]